MTYWRISMSPRGRIILNVFATYGRSLFAMVCGIFSGRWLLMVLGETDYGLYALIGGLMGLITFVNATLSGAVARFFAYSIGVTLTSSESQSSCRWFNTALSIHSVLSILLIAIGYPIGAWIIQHYLKMPSDRVIDCLWVFRASCVSCFIGMMTVPFSAMYIAKQFIAEITAYNLISTIVNISVLGYMVTHSGDWLVRYAVITCVVSVIPQLIICVRAARIFPECRIRTGFLFSRGQIIKIFRYVIWNVVGNLCYMVRSQGVSVVVNRYFGPSYNATMGVSNTVSAQTSQLAAALNGAFTPVVATRAGAGDRQGMMRVALMSCRYGMILTLLFVLPVAIECDYLIPLWLKNPPPDVISAALFGLVGLAISSSGRGMVLAITADGRISNFTIGLGVLDLLLLIFSWVAVRFCGCSFLVVMLFSVIYNVSWNVAAAMITKIQIGFPAMEWVRTCVLPMLLVSVFGAGVGLLLKVYFANGYLSAMFVMLVTTLVFCTLTYVFVLSKEEREIIVGQIRSKFLKRFK